MTILVSIVSIALFVAYFYAIGLWYLGLIPLILFVGLLVYSIGDISLKNKANSIVVDYGLFLARGIVLVGLFLSAKFFGVTTINSFLFLIIVNILFFLGSYIFNYHDGKAISHTGFIISVIALLIYLLIIGGINTTIQAFNCFWAFYTALIGFIIFVVGIKYEINDNYKYLFTVLLGGCLLILLFKLFDNTYLFLIVLLILLGLTYYLIYYILNHRPPTLNEQKEISVRRILAGERIIKNRGKDIEKRQKIYDFVENIPQLMKYCLEGVNTVIILILFYLYFKNAIGIAGSTEQLFYRIIMIGFIFNVYSLKRINYTSITQRLMTFLVINFAIYISLFSALKGDLGTIAFLCIIWNILSGSMIFSIHKTKFGKYLKKVDYVFWIFSTILALIVNIVLLFNVGLSNSLLFPTILLYVGLQGFMLYYSIKFVRKIQEIPVEEDKKEESETSL